MDYCASIGLEDISEGLPSYREEVISVPMDQVLRSAYENLEREITACVHEHRGNASVLGTMLYALLACPDHPYGFGKLVRSEFNPETRSRESFVIAETTGHSTAVAFTALIISGRSLNTTSVTLSRRCQNPTSHSPVKTNNAAVGRNVRFAWNVHSKTGVGCVYQIATRCVSGRNSFSPGFTSNALYHGPILRTASARYSAGECVSVITCWRRASGRSFEVQLCA
jgi:hypothetical protein